MRGLALGLASFCLCACVTVEAQDPDDPPPPSPPGLTQLREASADLHARLRDGIATGWDQELSRSRDFPELPLATRLALEDQGAWGLDLRALGRALDDEVRAAGLLRLSSDEAAVPAFLREESSGDEQPPGLGLACWLTRDARVGLRLWVLSSGEVLAEVLSEPNSP